MGDILDALSKGRSIPQTAPERELQQQADDSDARGPSLRHLLDESKESLLEAERAFLSKALELLQVIVRLLCPFIKLQRQILQGSTCQVTLTLEHVGSTLHQKGRRFVPLRGAHMRAWLGRFCIELP